MVNTFKDYFYFRDERSEPRKEVSILFLKFILTLDLRSEAQVKSYFNLSTSLCS
jgi:hypothetical protein